MITGEKSFSSRKNLISLIDIAPTILDLIGMHHPPHMKGQPAFGP
jgi:arylsulfatase A-like enzyme